MLRRLGFNRSATPKRSQMLSSRTLRCEPLEPRRMLSTYYVDATDGNDSWDGTASSYISGTTGPWQTVQKVNSETQSAGDSVLFKCGEVWRETLLPDSGNAAGDVTYGSYGTGDKPLLLGSMEMNDTGDWTNVSGNIWSTTTGSATVTGSELLSNTSFDSDTSGWTLYTSGATATGSRNTSVYDSSPASYSIACTDNTGTIKLYTDNISIETGEYYKLTFRAKASSAFDLASVRVSDPNDSAACASNNRYDNLSITTSWTTYTVVFEAYATTSTARLTFDLSNAIPDGETFYIDTLSFKECSLSDTFLPYDIGNIIFDEGDSCGVKELSQGALNAQGEFYYDPDTYTVKVYSTSNPASYYFDIELALGRTIIQSAVDTYVTIEGLALSNGGSSGISSTFTHYLTVQDCDLSFIGGRILKGSNLSRIGNGIEFSENTHDVLVENCKIWDIFDCGIAQTTYSGNQYNITYQNNIIWNCENSYKYYQVSGADTYDVYFENNTCAYAGSSWAHDQRSSTDGIHIKLPSQSGDVTDFYIRNNIFYESTDYGIQVGSTWNDIANLTLDYNLYYESSGDVADWQGTDYTYANFSSYVTASSKEAHSIAGDPQFVRESVDNFNIKYSSPAIDEGVNTGISDDCDGISRPQNGSYDIGAYEFAGTIYYVDATNGNDSWDGMAGAYESGTTGPWKTVKKVNTETQSAGDVILFKCGEMWREPLLPDSGDSSNDVTYGSYGTGDKPLLMGSVEMNDTGDWTNVSGNIWSTTTGTATVTGSELLSNPSFDSDTSGWTLNYTGDITGYRDDTVYDSSPAGYSIDCTGDTGTIKLYTEGISIETNEYYKLTFRAKATSALDLAKITLTDPNDAGTCGYNNNYDNLSIATSWTTYTVFFESFSTTSTARLTFDLSNKLLDGETFSIDTMSFKKCTLSDTFFMHDIGNIIFNEGDSCGVKEMSQGELDEQGDFWYDPDTYTVQVYSTSNPASYYSDVELALGRCIIASSADKYITIENLALSNGSNAGIVTSYTHYLTIHGCDVSFIGGTLWKSGSEVREGDAIQCYNNTHDVLVENCKVWDIYDCGLSLHTVGEVGIQHDITYRNNIVWNCEYCFAYFQTDGEAYNIYVENNTFAYAGYGWAHTQRCDPSATHVWLLDQGADIDNFYIRNNIFYESVDYCVWQKEPYTDLENITLDYNVYYQSAGYVAWWQGDYYTYSNYDSYILASGKDAHSIADDPDFKDAENYDFHLGSTSPAIDGGVDTGIVKDYDGESRLPDAYYDIGAYEYEGSVYYVDATNGNDSWDGTTGIYVSGTVGPWKTLQKVNSETQAAGDIVRLKCGEVWRETLLPDSGSSSGDVTYREYGTGDKPLIMGSMEMNDTGDWTNTSGNIWSTTTGTATITGSELLSNPSFDSDTSGWTLYTSGATATGSRNTSVYDSSPAGYSIDCTDNSGTIRLYTDNISIETGEYYKLTFRAKASAAFDLASVRVSDPNDSAACASNNRYDNLSITTSWTTYTVVFEAYATTSTARLTFDLSNAIPDGETFYIDTLSFKECSLSDTFLPYDIGNIIFDEGDSCGVKELSQGALNAQGEFYYDPDTYTVKVYSTSNPASYYSDIELALGRTIIQSAVDTYVTIEGLALSNGGSSGISSTFTHYLTVQDCDLSFIGGRILKGSNLSRIGNGIEFSENTHDVLVENCKIWDIFDCGIAQTTYSGNQYNITYQNNIIWNCENSYKYYQVSGADTYDVYFENNTCAYAGSSWAHDQRSSTDGIHIKLPSQSGDVTDFYIRNNIFYESTDYGIQVGSTWNDIANLTLDYNLYYESSGDVADWQGTTYSYANFSSYVTASGKEDHSIAGDPKFEDTANYDYDLESSSLAVNTGVDTGISKDHDGTCRPQESYYDIGANEYEGIVYYVDATNGNDSWDGTSGVYVSGTQGPWKTLQKVNSEEQDKGSTVHFKRGEVWREILLTDSGSNYSGDVTYRDYGEGDKPLLMGSVEMNGTGNWTNVSGNIWSTTTGTATVTGSELLSNPSFDSDTSGWTLNVSGATATGYRDTSVYDSSPAGYSIDCTDNSGTIKLYTDNISIETGEYYKLTFRAKATSAFDLVKIRLTDSEDPSTPAQNNLYDNVSITTSWATYTVVFESFSTTTTALLTFDLSNALPNGETFSIDTLSFKQCTLSDTFLPYDIGNIVFDEGDSCGVKEWDSGDLDAQGEYYYDPSTYTVQIYSTSNPASYYSDIELALGRAIIQSSADTHIKLENLSISNGGSNGISSTYTTYLTISDCDISFIGGRMRQSGETERCGSGIEFYGTTYEVLVENCKIWEVYDAGITNLTAGAGNQHDITYCNNIIWNCENSYEYYQNSGTTYDIYFENNTCAYAGSGWGHNQNPDADGIHLNLPDQSADVADFYIRNNIFYESSDFGILVGSTWNDLANLTLDYNLYYESSGDVADWQGTAYTYANFSNYVTASGKESNSIADDPDFDDAANYDFHLESTSPAIDEGTVTGIDYDYDGVSRPQNTYYDMGAFEYVSALKAACGEAVVPATSELSYAELQPIIDAAISRWSADGLADSAIAEMTQVEFVISDLSNDLLGTADANQIYIDFNAAGYGWFVDPTPMRNEEYARSHGSRQLSAIDPLALDRIDLLTVVEHELGHIAGFNDLSEPNQLMSDELGIGIRRIPRLHGRDGYDLVDDDFSRRDSHRTDMRQKTRNPLGELETAFWMMRKDKNDNTHDNIFATAGKTDDELYWL